MARRLNVAHARLHMAGRCHSFALTAPVIWLGSSPPTSQAQDAAPALVGRWDAVTRSAGGIGQIIELRADVLMTHWFAAMVEFTFVIQGSLLTTSYRPATGGLFEQ